MTNRPSLPFTVWPVLFVAPACLLLNGCAPGQDTGADSGAWDLTLSGAPWGLEGESPPDQSYPVGTVLVEGPAGTFEVTYQEINGQMIAEGDIDLGPVDMSVEPEDGAARPPMVGRVDTSYRWPNCVVPYEIMLTDTASIDSIEENIAHWEEHTPLVFQEATSGGRIGFIAPGTSTCSSCVGFVGGHTSSYGCSTTTARDDWQPLNFDTRCTATGKGVHEIGHALGSYHEHTRIDRDSYVQVIWANIDPTDTNFDARTSSSSVDFAEYDYGSIMHYSSGGRSTSSSPCTESDTSGCTLLKIDGSYITEYQRDGLSDADIDAFMEMYNDCLSDLSVGGLSLSASVGSPGDAFDAELASFGNDYDFIDASGFTASVYFSADSTISTEDTLACSQTWSSPVGEPDDETITCAVPSVAVGADYYVGVIIDSGDAVSESDEGNNAAVAASVFSVLSNLSASAVTVDTTSARRGERFSLSYTLSNTYDTQTLFTESVRFSADSTITSADVEACRRVVRVAEAGDTPRTIPGCAVPDVWAADYYVGVLLDGEDRIEELDEGDNAALAGATMSVGTTTIGGRPDLEVFDVELSEDAGDPGEGLTVDFVVNNDGDGAAGSFDVSVYFSTDEIFDAGDTEACVVSDSGLDGHSSEASSVPCSVPSLPAGDYYVWVVLDADDVVSEWREFNNADYAPTPYTVSPGATRGPDLTAYDATVSAERGDVGDGLEVSVLHTNDGDEDADTGYYIQISVHLSLDDVINPGDPVVCDTYVDAIDVGASTYYNLTSGEPGDGGHGCEVPAVDPGVYYLGVFVDTNDVVDEWNEDNNYTLAPTRFLVH